MVQLASVLLVLSLALPFSTLAAAHPAYLQVDGIVDPSRDVHIDAVPLRGVEEAHGFEALQDYDDVILSLVNERSLAGRDTGASRSRSHSHQNRAAKWTYVGCAIDSANRALDYQVQISGATPQKCQAVCAARGNVYSAMQYFDRCFCGDVLRNGQRQLAPESECNAACPGDKKQKCGGSWRNSLYLNSNALNSAATTSDPVIKSTTSTSAKTTAQPSITSKAATKAATTSKPTTTAQPTAKPQAVAPGVVESRRIGCFADVSQTQRMLSGANIQWNTNTPDVCWNWCANKGFLVAGVAYGSYCFCGNTIDWSLKKPDSECNRPCAGDSSLKCGGANLRMDVYTQSTNIEVGQPAVPSSGRKYLWAHHMVGNTYSYTQDIWKNDVTLAADAGIDGFALNMGRDDWQTDRVAKGYAAARAFHPNFKMFFSLDMTSLPCATAAQAVQYAELVASYKSHPNQAFYQNKLLLTLFDGAYCTYGQPNVNAGWAYFRSQLAARGVTAYIMPSVFVDLNSQTWYDGHFDWDNSWPSAGTDLDGSQDLAAKASLASRGKGYMPGVSPAFFTYYAPSSYNKNWIYRSDDWLLVTRLEQLIQQRASHDMAELISWNDYGESHYVGPVRVDQPMSQSWTTGMPHTGWLHLIRHYARAYRTGAYFTNRDSLYLWSRPHPKSGNPTNVTPGLSRPRNADYTEDNLYLVAILSAKSDVVVFSGANKVTYKNLPAGANKISVASEEGSIGAQIIRSGATVKNYNSGSTFRWSRTFRDWNFNYFVASAE